MWQPNEFNPIIRNYFDPDSDCMFRPCIVYHNREYHMWYSKSNSESEQMIGYAKSLDGIQWTLISDKVITPSKDLNRFDTYQAGNYCYRFDGTNLCSGIYYYICNVEGKTHCRKMMVVK
jgi:hypothetical protein